MDKSVCRRARHIDAMAAVAASKQPSPANPSVGRWVPRPPSRCPFFLAGRPDSFLAALACSLRSPRLSQRLRVPCLCLLPGRAAAPPPFFLHFFWLARIVVVVMLKEQRGSALNCSRMIFLGGWYHHHPRDGDDDHHCVDYSPSGSTTHPPTPPFCPPASASPLDPAFRLNSNSATSSPRD